MKQLLFAFIVFIIPFILFSDDVKQKLPSEEETKTALTTLRDVFKDEYRNLKKPEDRIALAKKTSRERR